MLNHRVNLLRPTSGTVPLVARGYNVYRRPVHCSATANAPATDVLVDMLKRGSRHLGEVAPEEFLKAVCTIEKARADLPENWFEIISAPEKRWHLIYTAGSKDVQAFLKGKPSKPGGFFPLTACQKFGDDNTFENGVFLGPVAHLTFKGPCTTSGKRLAFDVHTMYIGVGPWRVGIPLKPDGKPLSQVNPSEVKRLPFFLYAYIDEEMIIARGRSGGLALWIAEDIAWQASSGVLQVFK